MPGRFRVAWSPGWSAFGRALAGRLRRWADALDATAAPAGAQPAERPAARIASPKIIPPRIVSPQIAAGVSAGPPAHWVELVQRGAPHLLRNLPPAAPAPPQPRNQPAQRAAAKAYPVLKWTGRPAPRRAPDANLPLPSPAGAGRPASKPAVEFPRTAPPSSPTPRVEFPELPSPLFGAVEPDAWPNLPSGEGGAPLAWSETQERDLWPELPLAEAPEIEWQTEPDAEALLREAARRIALDIEQRGA